MAEQMLKLPDKPGIYRILNRLKGDFYIGSAINLRTRRNRHFSELKKGVHYNTHLQRAFNKYGQDAFNFEVLLICEPFELERYEKGYISMMNPVYNIRLDCTTNRGIKWTSRNENSLQALRTPKTQEQLGRRSLVLIMNRLKKNPNTGIQKQPSGKYRAMSGLGSVKHIGCFDTVEEARDAYLSYVNNKYRKYI